MMRGQMKYNPALDKAILEALRSDRFYNVTMETLLLSLPQVPEIGKHLSGTPVKQREAIYIALGRLWTGNAIVFEGPIVRVAKR